MVAKILNELAYTFTSLVLTYNISFALVCLHAAFIYIYAL